MVLQSVNRSNPDPSHSDNRPPPIDRSSVSTLTPPPILHPTPNHQVLRGVTGCMTFLAEEPVRQRAYTCLPHTVALLTHQSRSARVLAAAIQTVESRTHIHHMHHSPPTNANHVWTHPSTHHQVPLPRRLPAQGAHPRRARPPRGPGPQGAGGRPGRPHDAGRVVVP